MFLSSTKICEASKINKADPDQTAPVSLNWDHNVCLYAYVKLTFSDAVILNKSENATHQLSIFCEKVWDNKYLLKLNNVSQTSSKRFTNLSRLMSELCSLKCLKLFSLNFAIAHAQIKIVMLIKIGQNCVA